MGDKEGLKKHKEGANTKGLEGGEYLLEVYSNSNLRLRIVEETTLGA